MQQLNNNRIPVVAVPARNEAHLLPRMIASLAAQDWLAGGRRLDVVVVVNNSSDDSSAVLKAASKSHSGIALKLIDVELEEAQAHVGTARRLAMDTALALAADPASSVVLSTDADAMPARNWITSNLSAVDEGADLVGGHVIGDPEEERLLGQGYLHRAALRATYDILADRLAALIDPLPHDTWPRHSNHIGASLAVRGDVYGAVGGLPALPVREDIAFVSRVRAAGYRVRHALKARVVVSARLEGRAAGGMASCLSAWVRESAQSRPLMVEPAKAIWERLHRRRRLRDLGDPGSMCPAHLARLLGVNLTELLGIRHRLSTSMLIEHLVPEDEDSGRREPAERAIASLEAKIAACRAQDRAA